MSVADGVRVELYDPTGVTRQAVLNDCVRDVGWQDVLSRNGSAHFLVDANSPKAASITDQKIVKFRWNGRTFGAVVGASEECDLAVDGGRWLSFDLPGLGALLAEGGLYPEYGLARASSTLRRFGHMSNSVDRTSYVAPLGVQVKNDTTKRKNMPPEAALLAPTAMWIGVADPTVDQPAGAKFWTYRSFSLAAESRVAVLMAFDNDGQGFLDGELLFETDGLSNWKAFRRKDMVMASGSHTVAAAVTNGPDTTGTNALGFLCLIVTLTAAGNVDAMSRVLLKSETTNWKVSATEPGFSRAGVLERAHIESVGRSERGPGLLTRSFTGTLDTAGSAITDRGVFEEQVLNGGLDELAARLATTGLDWRIDADTMRLDVYNRMGVDRSAAGPGVTPVRLMLAQNLAEYRTKRTKARVTVAVGQLADGSWISVEDTAGITASGRIVTAVDLGGTAQVATAQGILSAVLGQSASPRVTATSVVSPYVGAVLGTDYWIGDTVLTPGHRGVGSIRSRCLGVTVDASGDVVSAVPQLVQDQSGGAV